jgi:CheY-like chemotaxis protein
MLLVEDDQVDAQAILRAFKKNKIANPVEVVQDGREALQALRCQGKYESLSRPDLVLLDLNMPGMNGIEFLSELRSDPDLKRIIVIVLTTSDLDKDKVEAYNLNVAGYILKSKVGENFVDLLTMLDCYWRIVEFPPQD